MGVDKNGFLDILNRESNCILVKLYQKKSKSIDNFEWK